MNQTRIPKIVDKNWWKEERQTPVKQVAIKKPRRTFSDKFYSVKEVAERFQVSLDFIYKQIHLGSLRCQHLGSVKRISHEDLEEYLQEQNVKKRA